MPPSLGATAGKGGGHLPWPAGDDCWCLDTGLLEETGGGHGPLTMTAVELYVAFELIRLCRDVTEFDVDRSRDVVRLPFGELSDVDDRPVDADLRRRDEVGLRYGPTGGAPGADPTCESPLRRPRSRR